MAFGNNWRFVAGILVGIGAGRLGRGVLPALAPLARPLTKQGLKLALLQYERGREAGAGFAESLSDLAAEVQAELQHERGMADAMETDLPASADNEPARVGD